MKKTLLLAGALILVLICASVFYNNYQDSIKTPSTPPNNSSETQEQKNPDNSDKNTNPNAIAAMNFTVYDESGNPVNLSDFYGKPIVVNFWATWCGPCKSELPAFETLYQEYYDVQFLMVNLTDGAQETVDGVSQFLVDNDYHFPVYFDTQADAALTYSVYSIPATLFIDADGNIVASHLGAMSEDTLRNYIENLLMAE